MRYIMYIAQDPISSTLLSLLDISPATAYIEVTEDSLKIKLGRLYEETLPLSNFGRASLSTWDWFSGLGLRTDFQGTVAPITSFERVVSIPLIQSKTLFLPILGMLGVQVPCKRLVVSLVEPDNFLIAFNANKTEDPMGPSAIKIE